MEIRKKNILQTTKHHSVKQSKRVCPIYLFVDKSPRTVPLILIKPDLQNFVDPVDSKVEELRKTFPTPQIELLRVPRKRTKDKRITERRKG